MSLVRRALRAAADLRDQLDLDVVRDAVRSSETTARAADPAGDDDGRVVARARALGAPDPYGLVTADEASVALGAPAGPAELTYGDDTIGVIHPAATEGGSGALSVSAFHAQEAGAPFDAAEHWHGFLAPVVADDARAVGGIGREALRTAGGLYVLGAEHVLYLTLRRPDGGATDAAMGALARAVLARLEPGA